MTVEKLRPLGFDAVSDRKSEALVRMKRQIDDLHERAAEFARTVPPPTILLVEDDDSTSRVMLLYLRQAGYGCTRVGTTHEARALLANNVYGAVIADQMLPDGDGWSLAVDVPKPTALILMSAMITEIDLEALKWRTRADHVIEVGDIEKLVDVVRGLLPAARH